MGSTGTVREIETLRVAVLDLQARVIQLESRIAELEAERSEFTVIDPPAGIGTTSRPLAGPEAAPAGSRSAASFTPAPRTSEQTETERRQIAEEVGRFLRRCVAGEPRGCSGRDRLQLASRYWVVIRDFNGQDHSPPLIFSRFSDCRALVKRGSDCGDSIFVGLPSKSDIRRALLAGGFRLPAELE